MRKLTHEALQIEDTMRYHFIPSFLNLGTTGILGLLFAVGAALSLGDTLAEYLALPTGSE